MSKSLYLAFIIMNIACMVPLHGKAIRADTLTNRSVAAKIDVTEKMYRKCLLQKDSIWMIDTLSNLIRQSKEKHDHASSALFYDLLGFCYFSHNRLGQGAAAYRSGIRISNRHGEKVIEAKITHDLGYQYYLKQNIPAGFEYMLRGNDLMKDIGYARYPGIVKYLYELAYSYYHVGYYEKTIMLLQDAFKYRMADTSYDIDVNNTLALAYLNQSSPDLNMAFTYFRQALQYARERKDTLYIGVVSGNIAGIHIRRNEYVKAIPLLQLDYEASMHYQEYRSASIAMLSTAKASLKRGETTLAHRQLDTARRLIAQDNKANKNMFSWYSTYYEILAKLYYQEQKIAAAYTALDSTLTASRNLWKNDNIKMTTQAESKIALERHLAKLDLMESERRQLLIRRNAVIIVLMLVVIIVLQALRHVRLRQKKDKETYELRAKRAEDEIRNARQQLATYKDHLQKNSRLIEDFKEKMQQFQSMAGRGPQENDQEIYDKLHSFTILREEDWVAFKNLFIKVHHNFFGRLHEKYPDLTQAETRFLALSKLGLTFNEMANVLGVSTDAVRRTRLRLRKKTAISEHELLRELSPF